MSDRWRTVQTPRSGRFRGVLPRCATEGAVSPSAFHAGTEEAEALRQDGPQRLSAATPCPQLVLQRSVLRLLSAA